MNSAGTSLLNSTSVQTSSTKEEAGSASAAVIEGVETVTGAATLAVVDTLADTALDVVEEPADTAVTTGTHPSEAAGAAVVGGSGTVEGSAASAGDDVEEGSAEEESFALWAAARSRSFCRRPGPFRLLGGGGGTFGTKCWEVGSQV